MNLKKIIIFSGLVVVTLAAAQIVLAQEEAVESSDTVTITSDQQGILPKENEMQWAWGEVTNLDNQANTITLKYLDYETDQEKEMVIVVDEKTVFENVKDFNALALNDTLSIDYIIASENRNLAQNISLETPEEASSAPVPVAENKPSVSLSSGTEQSMVGAAKPVIVQEAPAPVEPAPAPVEPAPAPVEPAPAPVESAPAPVESAPVSQDQAQ